MNAAASMAALMAQGEAQMCQQMGMQMLQNEQTNAVKLAETALQGERARMNVVEKIGNDMTADAASKLKGQHDSLSQASAA